MTKLQVADAPRVVADELRALGCGEVHGPHGDGVVCVEESESDPKECLVRREAKLRELEQRGYGGVLVVSIRTEHRPFRLGMNVGHVSEMAREAARLERASHV